MIANNDCTKKDNVNSDYNYNYTDNNSHNDNNYI